MSAPTGSSETSAESSEPSAGSSEPAAVSPPTGSSSDLVDERGTAGDFASGAVVALGVLAFALGLSTVFRFTSEATGVLGVGLYAAYGTLLALLGLSMLGLTAAVRADLVAATPSDSAGLLPGALTGLLWAGTAWTLAVHPLGLDAAGGAAAALLAGVAGGAATVLPREDVGTLVPTGAFVAVVGGVVVTGAVGPGWAWAPASLSATFPADVVVPTLAMGCGLLSSWGGAKTYGGFGAGGRQDGAHLFISLNAAGMLAVLALLVGWVVYKGHGAVLEGIQFGPGLSFHWPFLMNPSQGLGIQRGVAPAIVGTVWLVVGAVSFSVPLAVGAAVFLTEYAEQGPYTRAVEVVVNALWSTPSVVFGLFGLAFLVPRFNDQRSLLAGQLVLGFMLLPLVLITSREAIKSVPDEYRDASAALGVSKWETIRSVVLPAAMPGIVTGVILGVGRIAGETAPILLVASGATFPSAAPPVLRSFQFSARPPFVTNPALLEAGSALPYQLYAVVTAGVGADTAAFGWGTALVLLAVVLSFYAVGIAARTYFRRKLSHE